MVANAMPFNSAAPICMEAPLTPLPLFRVSLVQHQIPLMVKILVLWLSLRFTAHGLLVLGNNPAIPAAVPANSSPMTATIAPIAAGGNITPIKEANWFALPTFYSPRFEWSAIFIILPADTNT